MKKMFESKMAEVINGFETKSEIRGLAFEMIETQNRRGGNYYKLVANVPSLAFGIMGNNLKEVHIIISLQKTNDEDIYYEAEFQYEHKDGGRNGMNVMSPDGSERVRGIIEV